MPKNRIESFADGIFAFAATLLILNIAVDQAQPLGPQLLHTWPSYAAYAISFITIGIIGINHHQVMHQIAHVDRFFLLVTVVFLMFIAFIPFPTRLLALDIQTPDAEAAAVAYGITLTGTALLFNVMWRYAAWHRRLLRPDVDQRVVDGSVEATCSVLRHMESRRSAPWSARGSARFCMRPSPPSTSRRVRSSAAVPRNHSLYSSA